MLHHCSLRRPMLLPLAVCLSAAALLAAALTVFFCFYAPNWDVPLIHAACTVLLFLPLGLLLRSVWGRRVIQVEHAGVVVSDYLFGRLLHRRVFPAVRVRHFAAEPAENGGFSLSLWVAPRGWRGCSDPPRMLPVTILPTADAASAAALLQDLELHYPGSGWGEAVPESQPPAPPVPARWAGVAVALLGVLIGMCVAPLVVTPLQAAVRGQLTQAVVCGFAWETNRNGSFYRAVVYPVSLPEQRCTGATPFPQAPSMPREGQEIAVLQYDRTFYFPQEVLPFMLPLPLLLLTLLPVLCGLWYFLPSRMQK